MAKRSIAVAAVFGLLASFAVVFTGDEAAYTVAQKQPMKQAAMEGLYQGAEGADMSVMGILNPAKEVGDDQDAFIVNIKIPGMLSLFANREFGSFVPGVNDLVFGNEEQGIVGAGERIARGKQAIEYLKAYKDAKKLGLDDQAEQALTEFNKHKDDIGYGYLAEAGDIVPPVALTFYAFHVMVGLGFFFLLVFLLMLTYTKKGTLHSKKWLLRLGVACLPLAWVASEAGWVVAEVGRQPWAIQGLLPVSVANSNLTTGTVQTSFFIFLILFTLLLFAEIKIMLKQIKIGPEEDLT